MSLRTQRFLVMVVVLWVAMWLRVHRLVEIPPGVHFDEAANGLLAGDIGLRGARPIFIKAYTGKETLFFYLAGSLMFLLGQSVFVLRLTAAFVGLLTISATDWLCRELFPHQRWIGVFAALLLATNFVMVLFGRLGFRAITQPLFQTLTIAALLYGVRTGKRRGFVLGGICLGLTGYTYLAARLFPIVVGVVVLLLSGDFFLMRRGEGRKSFFTTEVQREQKVSSVIVHVLSFLGMAVVVILPLVGFFWVNADAFWVRIEQVSGDVRVWDYMRSYGEAVGMIAFEGDPYVRFNLPGRGVLRPLVAIISTVGMIVLVWRRLWLVIVLVVVGVGVMLLPTALAIGEITPSNLRAIGMFPFVLLPFGVGVDWILAHAKIQWYRNFFYHRDVEIAERFPQLFFAISINVLVCLGLVAGLGWVVYGDYFEEWGEREDVFLETEGDLIAVAQYLDDEVGSVGRIFVASEHYQHPSLAFLSERYEEIEWLVGGEALVFGGDGVVVYPAGVGAPEWVEAFLLQRRGESPEFISYRLGEDAFLLQRRRGYRELSVDFSGVVVLDGYGVEQVEDVVNVQLFWTVGSGTERDVIPFVHLEDGNGHRWAQNDSIGFLAEQWRPGDQIVYNIELEIPEGMPSGDYRLQIGLFDGERLPVVDGLGRFAGSTAIVDGVFVEGNGDYNGQIPFVKFDDFDDKGLLGHGGVVETIEAGASFPIELWWLDAKSDVVITVGEVVVDRWQVDNEFVVDRRVVEVPADLVGGMYDLRLVGYGNREIILGEIEILESERLFARPDVGVDVGAMFGDTIGLVGYTVDGNRLTLVWEAVTVPDEDYTVFVHLLDIDGTCCIWQQDARPQQNQYPTDRWIGGEFVVDMREMVLPRQSGTYPLEIGLYLAGTGERLPVHLWGKDVRDYLYISPIIVE